VSTPIHSRFPDGRVHLQHGPIDCIVEAWGAAAEVEAAYAQAVTRFEDVLQALVRELEILRSPVNGAYPLVRGPVAKRMVAAAWPHRAKFITPMAAVAGAVADELLCALLHGRKLDKAYVNDGGDIAFHLSGNAVFDIGIAAAPKLAEPVGELRIRAGDPVRGIATSGWQGRSQSLGIADAVTVLAADAAAADAAATMIANAVNVEHPAIRRLPAREIKVDSDLGKLRVTVEVGDLPLPAVEAALDEGGQVALALRSQGLIHSACLLLKGRMRVVPHRSSGLATARC
jgi:ApbE superfamily uncharacterized protein (UPF0280 family)